jgi:hypothetical protein
VATKWRPRGATTKDTMVCIRPSTVLRRSPSDSTQATPRSSAGWPHYPDPKILGAK